MRDLTKKKVSNITSLNDIFEDFNDFWEDFSEVSENVAYEKFLEKDGEEWKIDWDKTNQGLKNAAWGITAKFIARNFYVKFYKKKFAGKFDFFIDSFMSELVLVVAEIRRKEHVWSQVYIDLEKWTKNKNSSKVVKQEYSVLNKKLISENEEIVQSESDNSQSLARIIGSLKNLELDFSVYYPRFYPLFTRYVKLPDWF